MSTGSGSPQGLVRASRGHLERRGRDIRETGNMREPAFQTVRMLGGELLARPPVAIRMTSGTLNCPPDMCRSVAAVVHDLIERQQTEVDRHDLDDRPHAAERRSDAGVRRRQGRLEEAAQPACSDQGADRFRVGAYLRAAATVRSLAEPVGSGVPVTRGSRGSEGAAATSAKPSPARFASLLTHGRLPMLDRLRGEAEPVTLARARCPASATCSRIRLHDELGLETLADLEAAAHDGRLGDGCRIRRQSAWPASGTTLAHRLGRDAAGRRRSRHAQRVASFSTSIASTARRSPPVNFRRLRRGDSTRRARRGCPSCTRVAESQALHRALLQHGAGAPRRKDS